MSLPRDAANAASRWPSSRVLKTFAPEQAGARKLAQRYGKELFCVRHRVSSDGMHRLTTVELLVSVEPMRRRTALDAEVAVRLDFRDRQHRSALQQQGARWDAATKVWRLPRRVAIQLGLEAQIVV